jgi:hypothetical protein
MDINELDAFRLAGENDGHLRIAILKRGAQFRVRRCAPFWYLAAQTGHSAM